MLYVITGPPAAGKTTWINEHASADDIVIDLDRIAHALTINHPAQHVRNRHVMRCALDAREGAINRALLLTHECDVYLIHSIPDAHSLIRYSAHDTRFVIVDPGERIVRERIRRIRPAVMHRVADDWYGKRGNDFRSTLRLDNMISVCARSKAEARHA